MERSVALKKLTKLLGKNLRYRINEKAPSAEERNEARLALGPAVEERNSLRERRKARYDAILAADAEYQALCAETKLAEQKADKLCSLTRWFKITVGVNTGMFFLVKAEGDSWEDVLAKLAKADA